MFTDMSVRWVRSPESNLVYRLTVDEYERLAAAGALGNLRVELIDGLLVRKTIPGPTHARAVDAACEQLDRSLSPEWWIREEGPVLIPWFDVPEPDVSIVRGRARRFPRPTAGLRRHWLAGRGRRRQSRNRPE